MLNSTEAQELYQLPQHCQFDVVPVIENTDEQGNKSVSGGRVPKLYENDMIKSDSRGTRVSARRTWKSGDSVRELISLPLLEQTEGA
ncbi:hypothetical protein AALI21_12495 [Corynebacteriaceae bacterium 6-324]